MDGKLKNPPSPKNRYVVSDCKDVRTRLVLEFLVPLLYPEKPTRIIVTIGNIIFGAMTEEREVHWVLVIQNTIKRLHTIVGKSKASPLCPYLFHLYITHVVILPEDKKTYMTSESMLKHNVEPDKEELVGLEDLEREGLNAKEITELQAQLKKQVSNLSINMEELAILQD